MNVNNATAAGMNPQPITKQDQAQNGLGQDAFLKILVTQLKNQDPMEPMKDTEFIGQMAQFSSLEQLIQMNQNLARALENAPVAGDGPSSEEK